MKKCSYVCTQVTDERYLDHRFLKRPTPIYLKCLLFCLKPKTVHLAGSPRLIKPQTTEKNEK
jgi:hypothetical protein